MEIDFKKKNPKKPSFIEILLLIFVYLFSSVFRLVAYFLCISFPHLISRRRLLAFWLWRRISNATYEKPGETRKDKQNFYFSPSWRPCMYEDNSKIFIVSIFWFFFFFISSLFLNNKTEQYNPIKQNLSFWIFNISFTKMLF